MTPREPDPIAVPRFETLLTIPYVARQLAVHPSTVRNWIETQRIRSIRTPGGHYRIPASELARILVPK